MKNLIVLIPEGFFVKYFVYSPKGISGLEGEENFEVVRKGKVKFRGLGASNADIKNLIESHKSEAVAIRLLYGGNEFKEVTIYDESVTEKLERLIPQSPLHIPLSIRLIKLLGRTIPIPDVILLFETAFFVNLPLQERIYAVNDKSDETNARRFGYHGLFHDVALRKIEQKLGKECRIISICLEPVPEVAAIYNGKPIMVSSGSTPLDGIPGDTTCGEIDPGIVLLLEEKKRWGPEMINDMLTRKSGLSAIAGERTSIDEIFDGDEKYAPARKILEYRILLSCGSAMALMNGFDALIFSGKYIRSAGKLSEWLLPKLLEASYDKFKLKLPAIYFLRDSLEEIILNKMVHYLLQHADT